MKTFYSIVFCAIRPNVDEKVSIGLLMISEEKAYFNYSLEKLSIIRQLLLPDSYNLVRTTLKSLGKVFSECQSDVISAYKGQSLFKESYINYLSNYSNNLVTFSTPTAIDVELNPVIFNKLFEKFIFPLPGEHQERIKPVELVKKRLTKSISKHVTFDVELDENHVPGLIVPAKVWFIGKNEVEVTGEVKDFSGSVPLLQQQLNAHLFLIEKLKATPEGKNGKFFLIGDEPEKQLKENHSLWTNIRSAKILDIIPTNEVDRIESYMEVHGVEPIFKN